MAGARRVRELLIVKFIFLGLTFLKEHSGCSVDCGLEDAKGDAGNPGEGYYSDPAKRSWWPGIRLGA